MTQEELERIRNKAEFLLAELQFAQEQLQHGKSLALQLYKEGIRGTELTTIETKEIDTVIKEIRDRLSAFRERKEIHSEIAIPIKRGDEVLGVLNIEYSAPHQFSEDEIESLSKQVASVLSQVKDSEGMISTEIVLAIKGDAFQTLTPHDLATTISPFLNAISEIQRIIDEISGRKPRGIRIRAIRQESPISISLEGAAEAVQVVKDTVVPSWRKHAETMAHLSEQEKQAEIESKKAEVLEKRASAAKGRAEAEKLVAEAVKQREEAEKMKLENEKLRIELHRAKIQLALDILNQLAPNLSETDRVAYLIRLLPPLDTVISSNLEIVANTTKDVG
jgi:hypothetical protein